MDAALSLASATQSMDGLPSRMDPAVHTLGDARCTVSPGGTRAGVNIALQAKGQPAASSPAGY
jgi:hypothetical protein